MLLQEKARKFSKKEEDTPKGRVQFGRASTGQKQDDLKAK